MIHSVEIAFLFKSFKRLRLEREQIRQISLDLEQLTSVFFQSKRNEIFGSRGGPASDKIAMSLRATRQILNKTKDFFESLKYYLKM